MKFLYLIVGLIFSNSVVGQNKVDLTYFTIGLVDDYLGRIIVKADKLDVTKVDEFHEFESDLMDFLDSLINEENKLREKSNLITKKRVRRKEANCINCHEFFYYYSKQLASDVNHRYKFKFYHSWDEKNRKMYIGDLKSRTIKTDEQRLSFLCGAFVRVGSEENNLYVYNLANSRGHYNSIIKSLKKLNSEIVEIKIVEGTPTSQKIYFKPSDTLKLELQRYNGLKKKIGDRYNLFYKIEQ
jgi:hypothetical protein